jgi:hypothetical protein
MCNSSALTEHTAVYVPKYIGILSYHFVGAENESIDLFNYV